MALDRRSAVLWARAATPVTRAKLLADGLEADAQELIDAGLLVEFPDSRQPDLDASGAFFDLVAVPLSVAVGRDSEDWIIGNWKGEPLLRLGTTEHLIWSQLNGRASIAEAVGAVATAIKRPTRDLMDRVAPLFTALVASRAVALDRR